MAGVLRTWWRKLVPGHLRRSIAHKLRWPPVGHVNMGQLRRLEPMSRDFGYSRGTPVDRHYIEQFLHEKQALIRGSVLEIGTDMYTRRFGGERVTSSDVLHVTERNPGVTIVADLTDETAIEPDRVDCVILTQTLMFIYDLQATVRNVRRIPRPGGVVLATATGISPISRVDMDRWGHYWGLTTASMRRLFEDEFAPGNVDVGGMGNVLSATAFLHGMGLEELDPEELDHHDRDFPVIVTAVARKAP